MAAAGGGRRPASGTPARPPRACARSRRPRCGPGGGANHRGNLSDWILLKDNHLALLGIAEAVARPASVWPARTVHVECDRLDQVDEALEAGADALLLDNMTPDEVRGCVAAADDHVATVGAARCSRCPAASPSRPSPRYAGTGVDCISVGGLTNSAPCSTSASTSSRD